MRNNKKTNKLSVFIWPLGILCALILIAFILIKSPLFAVEVVRPTITLEAGDNRKLVPTDFLDNNDKTVSLSLIDDTALNRKEVGSYPIYIYHGFDKYTCHVNIVDTTAPTINCDIKNVTVQKDSFVSINSIGATAVDNTQIDRLLFTHVISDKVHVDANAQYPEYTEQLFYEGRDIWTESYTFEHGGIYTLTACAIDIYDNRSTLTLTVTVEEPPVIDVVSDIYIATKQQVDFLDYMTVSDFITEDLDAEDVQIDTSGVDITKEGTYEVLFTAVDSYGLTSTASTKLHYYTPENLQDLINTHVINKEHNIIIGAYNLYDSGYYEEHNPELIQEVMLPSIVHFENDALGTMGSGFILKIDDEFVTIATNEHVVNSDMLPEITFFDGTTCYGAVVAADPREDIAFVRIPIDEKGGNTSLSVEYIRLLRTVHINYQYWKELDNEAGIDICYNCIDVDGDVWEGTIGKLVYKEVKRDWNEYFDINETIISPDPVGGTSGSAIFDGYGRLIAMVRGYTTYDAGYVETVAVPLGEILTYYELIFREKLQYQ